MKANTRETLIALQSSLEDAYRAIHAEQPDLRGEARRKATSALDRVLDTQCYVDGVLNPVKQPAFDNCPVPVTAGSGWDPSW